MDCHELRCNSRNDESQCYRLAPLLMKSHNDTVANILIFIITNKPHRHCEA